MFNKRGISAIIATVLIILITVAAVTIIWVAIIPMIQNNLNIVDANARVEVVTTGGYTFYDKSTGTSYVQIRRGIDKEEITKIHIIYTINGTSETYVIDDSTYFPEPNGMKTITLPISEKPDIVKTVAYYLKSGRIKAGIPSSDAEIKESTAVKPIEDGDYTPSTDLEGNPIIDESGNHVEFLFRFIQVTDSHITTAGNQGASATDGRTDNCGSNYLGHFQDLYDEYCEEDGGSTAPTIAWIDATSAMNEISDVSFIIITGDLTAQGAFDGNKTESIDKFKEIASTLDYDYHITTHGRFHDKTDVIENKDYYIENVGPIDWSFTQGKNLFIGTSTINITQLNETLNAYNGQGITLFIFAHIKTGSLMSLLRDHIDNFREIIYAQGHVHINDYDYIEGGVHEITTTAIMNYPTEFRIFDVYADRIEIYMSDITSPEINAVSETLVDWYIYNQDNGLSPGLSRADPDNKIGLSGDEFERDFTIYLD